MDFAEKLAQLIELRQTSQPKLAKQVGIPQSGISKMTSGKRRPYLDQGFAIAQALGVSVDFLADDRRNEVPTEVLSDLEREVWRIVRTVGVEEAYRRLVQAPGLPVERQNVVLEPRVVKPGGQDVSRDKRGAG